MLVIECPYNTEGSTDMQKERKREIDNIKDSKEQYHAGEVKIYSLEEFENGESHYYIDGSVYKGGKLLLLGYDESDGKYYQIESDRKIPVRKYEEYIS